MNSKIYFNDVANQWDAMREEFFNESLREKAFDMACVKKREDGRRYRRRHRIYD